MADRAAIIYSHGSEFTQSGCNLAHYTAICLSVTGCAKRVDLVGFGAGEGAKVEPVSLLATHQSGKDVEASSGEVHTTSDLDVTSSAGFVVVCVDGADVEKCGSELANCIGKNKNCVVLAFLRGAEDGMALEKALPNNTVIVCCPCFDVLRQEHKGKPPTFYCTSDGHLVVERLNKEKQDCVDLLDLLDKAGFATWSRPTMTAVCWGRQLFQTFYATGALSGMTQAEQLSDSYHRVIYAQMIHEGTVALKKASKGNKWKPDSSGFSVFSVEQIEMILHLPTLLFWALLGWTGFGYKFEAKCPSPLTQDLNARLKTDVGDINRKIVSVAEQYNCKAPINKMVAQLVEEMAKSKKAGKEPKLLSGKELYDKCGSLKASRRKFNNWLLQVVSVVVCFVSLVTGYFMM